ncbi:MAG: hypothetical protein E7199_05560 [Schwartzia succinivorans]|nr:hypothetical protein [Schwartzia succinivorans]
MTFRKMVGGLVRWILPKMLYVKLWEVIFVPAKVIDDSTRWILPKPLYVKLRKIKMRKRLERVKAEKEKYNQIVVIGDSHSRFFSGATVSTEIEIHFDDNGSIKYNDGNDKRFCAFKLGPALAYNLNKEGTSVRAREKYNTLLKMGIIRGGVLICAFGEIDIRMHVFKYAKNDEEYKRVVQNICNNYIDFLDKVYQDGVYPVVWGPIASQKEEWYDPIKNPSVGNEVERNKATLFFNDYMKTECKKRQYGFFSIAGKLIDPDYKTIGEFIYDGCHLGQNAKELFEPEFKKLILDLKERGVR